MDANTEVNENLGNELRLDETLALKARLLKESKYFVNADLKHSLDSEQDIFLVMAGVKPAGWVVIGSDSRPDDSEEVVQLLDQLGILFKLIPEERTLGVVFANTQDTLDKLVDNYINGKVETELEGKNKNAEAGLLLGYPNTAIQALVDWQLLAREEQQQVLVNHGIDKEFIKFRFSRDHFEEEVKVLEKWYQVVRSYDLTNGSRM